MDKKLQRMLEQLRSLPNIDVQTATGLALLAIGVFCFIRYIIFVNHWFMFPCQLDYGESPNMYVSYLWSTGQWKWDINVTPYFTSVYPPVFFIIASPFIKLFGYSLQIGRAIEIVSFLSCVVVLYFIVKQYVQNKYLAWGIALLPLTICIIRDWSIMAKPDFLAILFELIGIFFVVKYFKSKWLFVSIIFFALAFFAKQNIVAGAIATCLFLLITQFKNGIAYSVTFVSSVLFILIIGDALTNSEFHKHIFIYTQTVPYFQQWQVIAKLFMVSYLPFAVAFGMCVWYCWKFKRSLNYPMLFFIVALVIDLVIIGKKGGFVNYQIEIAFATFILLSIVIQFILKHYKSFLVVGMLVPQIIIFGNFNDAIYMPKEYYLKSTNEVTGIIQDTDKPVYSENIGVVLKANKQPYNESFVFSNLASARLWNNQILKDDLVNKNFDYVILERELGDYKNERTLPEIQDLISKNYSLIYKVIDEKEPNFYEYNFYVYKVNK